MSPSWMLIRIAWESLKSAQSLDLTPQWIPGTDSSKSSPGDFNVQPGLRITRIQERVEYEQIYTPQENNGNLSLKI